MFDAKELDSILDKMVNIAANAVDDALDYKLLPEDLKDLSEATAVILSIGYTRIKNEQTN